ncbi:unnamed protein product [Closterium sp. NIES-53]
MPIPKYITRDGGHLASTHVFIFGTLHGQRQQQQRRSETPTPQQLREWFAQREACRGSVRCPYVIRTGDRAGQTWGKLHTQHRCFSRLDDAWRTEFGDEAKRPRWLELLNSGVDIFALDYDAILAAMYALYVSVEGDCYLYVPPDLGIEAAVLGASDSAFPGTPPAEALHSFTLDSGASRCFFRDSTTLTPLPAPVLVRLAGPSEGPVLARSSTVLPCPVVPSGSLSGLHLPSFFASLVSTAALQDAMVTTTTPGGQRVSICTCTRTGRHLATFTRQPGSKWRLLQECLECNLAKAFEAIRTAVTLHKWRFVISLALVLREFGTDGGFAVRLQWRRTIRLPLRESLEPNLVANHWNQTRHTRLSLRANHPVKTPGS